MARSVNMDKCTGCGVCQEKCPSKKIPNEFNRGLNNRSAIYTPFAQAIPNVPVIDREHCLKFKTGKCGVCSKVCQAGAIDYDQQDEIVTQKYGAIVVATGFDTIKLDKYDEYALQPEQGCDHISGAGAYHECCRTYKGTS